jgi:hypothetical protein
MLPLYNHHLLIIYVARMFSSETITFSIPAIGWDFIKYVLDISKVYIWVTDTYGSSTENRICHLAQGYHIIAQHFHKCRNAIPIIQDSSFEVDNDYL